VSRNAEAAAVSPEPLGAVDRPDAAPLLRGVLHEGACYAALVAAVPFVLSANGSLATTAAAVFAAGTVVMFAASALFHRLPWSAGAHRWMRRADHAGIYLMIAASYTPYGLLALDGAWRFAVLGVVWAGVLIGITVKSVWVDAPGWVTAAIAVALGWVSVVALPQALEALGLAGFLLLMLGGAFYTAGALVYALRRPNPFPSVFGFHELFHAFVNAAVACHYAAVAFFLVPGA
jgi:hemolysin III